MTRTRFAVVYLTALVLFGWGLIAGRYQVLPWRYIQPVEDFVRGHATETTSLAQKLSNDLGLAPERIIMRYTAPDASEFRPLRVAGLKERRDPPRLWISPVAPAKYRLIAGAFDFERAIWGALLLDPSGNVIHRWYMNQELAELTDVPDQLKTLYGVAFLPDGSAIFTMQERGGGLVKIDACSEIEWTKKGLFHHDIALTDDQAAFWTFGGGQGELHPRLLLVDAETGQTLREIDMADVEKANPDTFIFDLQRAANVEHATHPNGVSPLPKAIAHAHPHFAAGDLVLSYHTTNLIFVIDPRTLKIKWWYVGAGDGQHDPDWQADGTITIFNNLLRGSRRGTPLVSSVVSIDPVANTHRTLIDGTRHGVYSEINGNHEVGPEGSITMTSSRQGRVVEIDRASGRKTFDFVNAYEWEKGRTLHLAETFYVDEAMARKWASRACPAQTAATDRN